MLMRERAEIVMNSVGLMISSQLTRRLGLDLNHTLNKK